MLLVNPVCALGAVICLCCKKKLFCLPSNSPRIFFRSVNEMLVTHFVPFVIFGCQFIPSSFNLNMLLLSQKPEFVLAYLTSIYSQSVLPFSSLLSFIKCDISPLQVNCPEYLWFFKYFRSLNCFPSFVAFKIPSLCICFVVKLLFLHSTEL